MQKTIEYTKPRVAKWLVALEAETRGTITDPVTAGALTDLQNFLSSLLTTKDKAPKKVVKKEQKIEVPYNPNLYKHVKEALAEGRITEEGKKGS